MAAAEVRLASAPDGTLVLTNEPASGFRPRPSLGLAPSPRGSALVSRETVAERIARYATDRQLDPELVRAVVQVESAYDPGATSHKGAMGLMQLMPETAARYVVADPYDPDENLRGGTAYLSELLDLFEGRLELALAGYNAGPEAVHRHGGIPPYRETRDYIERVLRLYRGDASAPLLPALGGRKVYLLRTPAGLVMTTTPPR